MTQPKCSLLVVDDEPHILATLAALLNPDYEVITAQHPDDAQQVFKTRSIDLVLSDQKMPRMSGVQFLEWVRQNYPKTVRLMMTGFAELEEAVDAINKGQVFRYIFKPWKHEELIEILNSACHSFQLERSHERLLVETRELNDKLREMNADLERRVVERTKALEQAYVELEQKNKMLEKLALTDPLTNLPNRRAMDRLVERELRRRERYPGPIALAILDVDHFKSINDRFLLPGGDRVLTDLAKVLSASLRTVDFLGRIGGEEFMLIAPETDVAGAMVLGERIRTAIERAVFGYNGHTIPVRISLGYAVAEPGVPTDYESLKHLAAAALSEAKKTGRNKCVYYTVPKHPFEQAG